MLQHLPAGVDVCAYLAAQDLALCEELLTQYPGAEMSLTILGEFHAVITAESVATGGGLLHTVTSPASAK